MLSDSSGSFFFIQKTHWERRKMSLHNIRKKQPLVHCITNYVVSNVTANGLLAIGASPVMADEVNEVEEMVSIANGLLLNIGTLNERTLNAMIVAGKKANEKNIPVVLDPVGVGATSYRKEAVEQIIHEVRIDVLRCNIGELAAIANVPWTAKGVDSGEGIMDIASIAKNTAKQLNCIVVVTGAIDYVTDGVSSYQIGGGDERATQITGAGCLLSAICAGALALEGNKLENIEHVLKDYKKVGEYASKASHMGSFQVEFLNGLDVISRGEQ